MITDERLAEMITMISIADPQERLELAMELQRLRAVVKRLPRFTDGPVIQEGDTAWFCDGNNRVTGCVLDRTRTPFIEEIATITQARNHVAFHISNGELRASDLYPIYSTREAAEAAKGKP